MKKLLKKSGLRFFCIIFGIIGISFFSIVSAQTSPSINQTTTKKQTTKSTVKKTSKTTKTNTPQSDIKDKEQNTKLKEDNDDKEVLKKKKEKEECKEIEVIKKCKEWEEWCEKGEKKIKEKVCEKDESVPLPKEVQDLFNTINTKYWPNSSHVVEYNWSTYDNSTIIYWAIAMKDLKDWILGIDSQIKIDYELAKLSKLNMGNAIIDSSTAWYTPWVRSARSYITWAFYNKSTKVMGALYTLAWNQEMTQKIQAIWQARLEGMTFLSEMWILYAIAMQENGAAYAWENAADKEQIKQYANNGGIFQLTRICWNYNEKSIEKNTWGYIDASWIGGMWNYLKFNGTMSNPYDKQCADIAWWLDKFAPTDEAYIKMWKQLAQVDPERYQFMKNGAFAGSSNEAQLYIYLGRELSFMYQFYNIGAFYEGKFWRWLSKTAIIKKTYSLNQSFKFVKQFLDVNKPNHSYTIEDWVKDVITWSNYAKRWYTGQAQFVLQEKMWNEFPSTKLSMRFTSTEHWADFIFNNFVGAIGALYNGVNAWYWSIWWSPYVAKHAPRALQNRYWLPSTCWQRIKQCRENCTSYIEKAGFTEGKGMYLQNRSFLSEVYWVPVAYSQGKTDWYLIMLKFLTRNHNKNGYRHLLGKAKNVSTSCLEDGSIAY